MSAIEHRPVVSPVQISGPEAARRVIADTAAKVGGKEVERLAKLLRQAPHLDIEHRGESPEAFRNLASLRLYATKQGTKLERFIEDQLSSAGCKTAHLDDLKMLMSFPGSEMSESIARFLCSLPPLSKEDLAFFQKRPDSLISQFTLAKAAPEGPEKRNAEAALTERVAAFAEGIKTGDQPSNLLQSLFATDMLKPEHVDRVVEAMVAARSVSTAQLDEVMLVARDRVKEITVRFLADEEPKPVPPALFDPEVVGKGVISAERLAGKPAHMAAIAKTGMSTDAVLAALKDSSREDQCTYFLELLKGGWGPALRESIALVGPQAIADIAAFADSSRIRKIRSELDQRIRNLCEPEAGESIRAKDHMAEALITLLRRSLDGVNGSFSPASLDATRQFAQTLVEFGVIVQKDTGTLIDTCANGGDEAVRELAKTQALEVQPFNPETLAANTLR
ncbi:MAG: hypothetical protein AAF654_06510 [Myxococcota bacterium]